MNNKESLFTKCIKRFYGITGPLDEYKRQEINRIGNNAFIVCWIYIMLSNFMFFFLGYNHPEYSVIIYGGSNFIFLMLISIYIIVASHRSGLTINEVAEKNYKNEKRKISYRIILSGIYFGFIIYLLNPLTSVVVDHKSYLNQIIHPSKGDLLQCLFETFFWCLFMYLIMKSRMKKMK
ncbi:DUF3278 domain-containing protein [Apilactobacillus micheneri]|nr:DUF3278 domain-containing protein [Apilactobacillus micheneri]